MDGHDKLMGYQNSTFPLAIYGSIGTASRKILWLKIWTGNSDPKRITRWYLEYLYENKTIASHIRIIDTVIHGPSTSNQVCHYFRKMKFH